MHIHSLRFALDTHVDCKCGSSSRDRQWIESVAGDIGQNYGIVVVVIILYMEEKGIVRVSLVVFQLKRGNGGAFAM
jgi:hypothetical protein